LDLLSDLGARNQVPFARETLRPRADARPRHPDAEDRQPNVSIVVIFTSVESTLLALQKAGDLARQLNGRIKIVIPQVVPYPLPLTSPPVRPDLIERRFQVMAQAGPVATVVQVCLCRDPSETLSAVLKPHSLVMLGGRRKWWLAPEQRMARRLQRAGHEVIFVEGE
jgi:hypothetical protein